jgi:hypothetical protein
MTYGKCWTVEIGKSLCHKSQEHQEPEQLNQLQAGLTDNNTHDVCLCAYNSQFSHNLYITSIIPVCCNGLIMIDSSL